VHHFQGQKVKDQLAGGGGILWPPPAQLVIVNESSSTPLPHEEHIKTTCFVFYLQQIFLRSQRYMNFS